MGERQKGRVISVYYSSGWRIEIESGRCCNISHKAGQVYACMYGGGERQKQYSRVYEGALAAKDAEIFKCNQLSRTRGFRADTLMSLSIGMWLAG